MNRPIFITVIGYIIGIIWGLYLNVSIVLFYIFLVIIFLIINYEYTKKEFKILSIKRYFRYLKIVLKVNIILIIIISSFISNMIVKYYNQKYEKMYKNIEEIQLTAIVVSNKEEKEYSNRYKIKVIQEEYKNSYLYIDIYKNIQLEYGDKINVKGDFKEPQTARNYKGFDYKEYLKTLKIYGSIKVNEIKVKEKNCGNKLNEISNILFLKIKNNIENTYSEDISGIILGVILGYTKNIDEEVKDQFSESNISHVLAVSGIHVSYIIYLVTNSTNKILGKRKSKIIASIVLIFYMCITGFSISVVRACIMGIISCMSFVLYRKNDTLNNISISALIILINNPFSIYSLSFLLTYGGTIGIIIFKSTIEKMLKNIKVKNRKWKYIFIQIQRRIETVIETIAISISAQIIIAPIIALDFNTIGISFIITNLLLSLVIGPIVIIGFIQILISFISIEFAIAIASVLEKLVYILVLISKIGSNIPFGNFKIVTPDLYQILFYYVLIFILNYFYIIFHKRNLNQSQVRLKNMVHLIRYKKRPYKKKFISICILIIIAFFIINKIPHQLKIYFIDVGQGDSTLIVTPYDKTILIDGGGSTTYDVGKNTLVPYLLDRKINRLDYVIISHFDQDHVGGIFSVLEELEVGHVIISEQIEDSENYKMFLKIIKEKKINIKKVKIGDRILIEKNLYFDVLWPSENQILDNALNNNSIVCKLNYYNFSLLFTGDIESIAEERILQEVNNKCLEADILKVGHHGSKTSSIKKFIETIKPKITLIGVGENNKFGHPNSEVLNRLNELRCKSL